MRRVHPLLSCQLWGTACVASSSLSSLLAAFFPAGKDAMGRTLGAVHGFYVTGSPACCFAVHLLGSWAKQPHALLQAQRGPGAGRHQRSREPQGGFPDLVGRRHPQGQSCQGAAMLCCLPLLVGTRLSAAAWHALLRHGK